MRETERLQRLLNDGYTIDSVESDATMVEATLRRGPAIVILTFGPGEASDLLYAMPPLRRPPSTRGA